MFGIKDNALYNATIVESYLQLSNLSGNDQVTDRSMITGQFIMLLSLQTKRQCIHHVLVQFTYTLCCKLIPR